jgi:hypothetical protein
MLFQEATPDTLNYMLLGFAVLLGVPLLYILTFFIRRRNLERDLRLIESLKEDND